MSGQLYAQAALFSGEPLPLSKEPGWAPEPVQEFFEEKYIVSPLGLELLIFKPHHLVAVT